MEQISTSPSTCQLAADALGYKRWDGVVVQDVGHPLNKEQMGAAFERVVGVIHANSLACC